MQTTNEKKYFLLYYTSTKKQIRTIKEQQYHSMYSKNQNSNLTASFAISRFRSTIVVRMQYITSSEVPKVVKGYPSKLDKLWLPDRASNKVLIAKGMVEYSGTKGKRPRKQTKNPAVATRNTSPKVLLILYIFF